MTDEAYQFAELIAWLKEEGYSEDQVHRILAEVRKHDRLTMTDSLMDSIADGTFDLDGLISEALDRQREP